MRATRTSRRTWALLVGALLASCVDSSLPDDGGGFPPPPDPPTIDVVPPTWKTVPGKTQTFQAIDPVSNQPLLWTPPAGLSVIEIESHSITLGSGQKKGQFQLGVRSSVDPEVVGSAAIEVVPFGFSGTLGGQAGNAAHVPYSDVAVTRGEGALAERRVFLALYDATSGRNEVQVWDHDFALLLDVHVDAHFNPAQRPRVAADAQGRAFWIEQYYDAASGQRAKRLVRRSVSGALDVFEWTAAATGGLDLVVGSDLACDDDGVLYLMTSDGFSNSVARFADPFGAPAPPEVLAPLAAAGPQVQLAVDAQGRLLVARDTQLERWSVLPAGGLAIEFLADLGAAPADLDADADGTLYALLDTELDVLDGLGQVVAVIAAGQVGLPEKVPFEHLQGLGVDGDGNLRLSDDPLADDPALGAVALRTFALDVQLP